MNNKILITTMLICGFIFSSANAEDTYISGDFGINFASSLDTMGSDNDVPSRCDGHIFGANAITDNCPRDQSSWHNDFSSANGFLASLAIGKKFSAFRAELEYFYRSSDYDDTSPITADGADVVAKVDGELVRAEERIATLKAHNIFVNGYYDFTTTSKWKPYIGAGVGIAKTDIDYSGVFARNTDENGITSLQSTPLAGRENELAGTTTTESNSLNDSIWGYQLIGGFDYAFAKHLTIGIKARYVKFNSFEDGDTWDQLRSHPSSIDPNDPNSTVSYKFETDDIEFSAISLNLKYVF